MRPSRQWLLAVAPAVGIAAVVVPGLGAHANAPSSETACGEHDGPTTSAALDVAPTLPCAPHDGAHHGERDDGRRDGGEHDGEDGRGHADDVPRTTGRTVTVGDPTSVTSTSTSSTSSSTSSSTTSSSTSTSSTSTTSTSTSTTLPLAPALTVAEQFTQLVTGQPMLLSLTVTNTSAGPHTVDMTVEVKGTSNLPPYLNVNSDSTQTLLPNWSCTPTEVQHPSTDNVFTCAGVVIPANTANVVMVTTGSRFTASGATVSVTATVTSIDGSAANLPAAATASGNVA